MEWGMLYAILNLPNSTQHLGLHPQQSIPIPIPNTTQSKLSVENWEWNAVTSHKPYNRPVCAHLKQWLQYGDSSIAELKGI